MAQQVAPSTGLTPVPDHDFMPLHGIDHVELYVGNALQAAYFYAHAFGFKRGRLRAASRPARATAPRTCSQQGRIRLVLTGALHSGLADRRAPRQARRRREGHRAVRCPTSTHAYREATEPRRRRASRAARASTDEHGTVRLATIATYGETLHTFVDRCDYDGAFLPGYEPVEDGTDGRRHAARPSTTSSATSSSARWRRG